MGVPAEVSAFLQGPVWSYLGSSDPEVVPRIHRCFGVSEADGRVVVRVPVVFAGGLRERLESHPVVALTSSVGTTFETYQVKGRVVCHRAGDEQDAKFQESYRALMLDLYGPWGEHLKAFVQGHPAFPCEVIEIEVDTVFNQTPGPDAGAPYGAKEGSDG
jgi:hypothetical protein